MRFEVPKFIEFEDKIFGPFTWKQFLYLGGGVGSILIAQHFTQSFFWAIIITSPITAIALALTFYKINGQEFSVILKAAVQYYFKQKLYIWNGKQLKNKQPNATETQNSVAETVTDETLVDKTPRIKDVSWGLDVLDRE